MLQNTNPETNLVDLYNALPRFTYGPNEVLSFQQSVSTRTASFGSDTVSIKVNAAIITRLDKEEKKCRLGIFPGEREELVEKALKEIAISGQAKLIDNGTGIQFPLYELCKELLRNDHAYSIYQIVEALLILRGATITCTNLSNKSSFSTNFIDNISITSSKDWQNDANGICTLHFNPMTQL